GNLTVADAIELAGDLDDPSLSTYAEHGWRIRSADDLPELQFLLRWARAAGAVRVAKGRMSTTASWAKLDPMAQVARATTALLDKGPVGLRTADNRWVDQTLIEAIDAGAVHLLAVLW